jgi:hypothetical protein
MTEGSGIPTLKNVFNPFFVSTDLTGATASPDEIASAETCPTDSCTASFDDDDTEDYTTVNYTLPTYPSYTYPTYPTYAYRNYTYGAYSYSYGNYSYGDYGTYSNSGGYYYYNYPDLNVPTVVTMMSPQAGARGGRLQRHINKILRNSGRIQN